MIVSATKITEPTAAELLRQRREKGYRVAKPVPLESGKRYAVLVLELADDTAAAVIERALEKSEKVTQAKILFDYSTPASLPDHTHVEAKIGAQIRFVENRPIAFPELEP
jgi:hypothetical protein